MTPPGGTEERVRGERMIAAGTLLRMGMTRMRLERAEAHTSQQPGGAPCLIEAAAEQGPECTAIRGVLLPPML